MIIVNKLYRKDFNQYSKDDWKYIFSIYTLRDKYNFTEEAFLSLELTGKITMLKKMDESLYVWGEFDDVMHDDESVFAPCPEDEGCKVIQDFLEDEDVSACNPENSCDVIQDFLEEGGVDKFSIFRSTQTECYDEIYQCQNRIEECKKKIRAEIQDIVAYKQRLDEAFNQYIE